MTRRRRTASVAFQKPLTKMEASGVLNSVPKVPRNEVGNPVLCHICQKPGGTLLTDGLDKSNKKQYCHQDCKE